MDIPETKYAKTPDGIHIAYQTLGDGPRELVLVPALVGIDLMWDDPFYARVLHRLAGLGRLICLDPRGLGSSDPPPLGVLPTAEAWMDDVRVVMDACGSEQASLIFESVVGFLGVLFAATHPGRTSGLVLINCWHYAMASDDLPELGGHTPETLETVAATFERWWGTEGWGASFVPSRAEDRVFLRWFARAGRLTMAPGAIAAFARWQPSYDLRPILPTISAPTLVMQQLDSGWGGMFRTKVDDGWIRVGRYLADHIPNGELCLLPGQDPPFLSQNADVWLDEIQEFLTGQRPMVEPDRALATVLFTDIVSSTAQASAFGDKQWRHLLDQHDTLVARELERHRGRKVNPTGDGMLASFDGPARAVRCAQAIIESVRPLGIEVRAGLHTGEVELRGDDIGGIAVHIGQRVSAMAGPGEVLVSRTVTDLVAGSGLQFEERGDHELKGVPGKWAIYAVMS